MDLPLPEEFQTDSPDKTMVSLGKVKSQKTHAGGAASSSSLSSSDSTASSTNTSGVASCTDASHAANIRSADTPWNQKEQIQLERALKMIPKDVPNRWKRIAEQVYGRSAKACALRVKELASLSRAGPSQNSSEARTKSSETLPIPHNALTTSAFEQTSRSINSSAAAPESTCPHKKDKHNDLKKKSVEKSRKDYREGRSRNPEQFDAAHSDLSASTPEFIPQAMLVATAQRLIPGTSRQGPDTVPRTQNRSNTQSKRSRHRKETSGSRRKERSGHARTTENNEGDKTLAPTSTSHKLVSVSTPSKAVPESSSRKVTGSRKPKQEEIDASLDLAESLKTKLTNQSYECMICYDNVKRNQPIWSCNKCFCVIHLTCIKKWASKSRDSGDSSWRCPGCQDLNQQIPKRYKCFCGKLPDPRWQGHGIPHTCGESCNKSREHCEHECHEPCHPGPCPPCPIMVTRSCFCGVETTKIRCSSDFTVSSCGGLCGKLLNCKVHTCERVCHAGPCSDCDRTETQNCFCGKTQDERPCGSGYSEGGLIRKFCCEQTCSKKLECGIHTCAQICHPGTCNPCDLMPSKVLTCPCGKVLQVQLGNKRENCTDPVLTCDSVCYKMLACGHRCSVKCHTGPCPPCTELVNVTCKCGATSAQGQCYLVTSGDFNAPVCMQECGRKLSCGRHRCMTICCPHREDSTSEAHTCMRVCGKLLRCGKHHCDQLCHKGHCAPCLQSVFEDVTCECGKTVLEPPVPCGTPRPDCKHPCARQHTCEHPPQHSCHYDEACPPCPVLVSKMCAGGHGIMHHVRCGAKEVTCGRICGKILSCGEHTCPTLCHSPQRQCESTYAHAPEGPILVAPSESLKPKQLDPSDTEPVDSWEDLDEDDEEADKEKEEVEENRSDNLSAPTPQIKSCGLKCGKLRVCGHPCPVRCHPGSPCPPVVCREKVIAKCKCGHRSATVECRYGDSSLAATHAGFYAKKQLKFTSATSAMNDIVEIDFQSAVDDEEWKPRLIACDKKCTEYKKQKDQEKRNRMLASALKIDDADISAAVPDHYSESLVTTSKLKPRFIRMLQNVFADFIRSGNRRHGLPVMKEADRRIVHELAEHYNLDSASYDPEPKRNVVIFRSEFRNPRLPSPLLLE